MFTPTCRSDPSIFGRWRLPRVHARQRSRLTGGLVVAFSGPRTTNRSLLFSTTPVTLVTTSSRDGGRGWLVDGNRWPNVTVLCSGSDVDACRRSFFESLPVGAATSWHLRARWPGGSESNGMGPAAHLRAMSTGNRKKKKQVTGYRYHYRGNGHWWVGGGGKRTRSSPQLPRTIEIYASRFIDFFFPPNRRTRRFWAMFRRPLPPGRVDLRFYRNNPLRDNTRLSWRDLKFLFAWEGPGEQCGAQTTKNSSTIEIKNNLNEYYQR